MKALVFGAGKIARGFVGQLLFMNHIDITFVDASKRLVDGLRQQSYYLTSVLGNPEKNTRVDRFRILNNEEVDLLYQTFQCADAFFISVGGNNLDHVAPLVAKCVENTSVIKDRSFILCENRVHAADDFRNMVYAYLSESGQSKWKNHYGVTEAVILRTATDPPKNADVPPYTVCVQDYWKMPVDASRYIGERLPIPQIQWTERFGDLMTQKMYTNNTSSAIIAYNGYLKGYRIFSEASMNSEINAKLKEGYQEINETLIRALGVSEADQLQFAKRAEEKYTNPLIIDYVTRHGRDPIRKLGPNERLIGPATLALRHGVFPNVIIDAISRALYFDPEEDESAQELKKIRRNYGVPYILSHICGLSEEDRLYQCVLAHEKKLREAGAFLGHE